MIIIYAHNNIKICTCGGQRLKVLIVCMIEFTDKTVDVRGSISTSGEKKKGVVHVYHFKLASRSQLKPSPISAHSV